MLAWAGITERNTEVADLKYKHGDWRRRGRGDVAGDVMRIVGIVLWSSRTSSVPGFKFGERRYDDSLFGRDYTCKTASRLYQPLEFIVNQTGPNSQPDFGA